MLGGAPTPAVGFAMGVERLFTLVSKIEKEKIDFFVVSTNQKETLKLTQKLRQNSKKVDFDFSARKFSKQLEKASKVARYALILGEDELEKGYFSVKNLENGTQEKIDNFEELLKI